MSVWFQGSPIIIKVPFFLLFGVDKGTLKQKGQKGTTQEPRLAFGRVYGRITINLKPLTPP